MTPVAGYLLALLAATGWATDAQTDQRAMARLQEAAKAGRMVDVLSGTQDQPPEVLDVMAQAAACAGHPDLLRVLIERGARPRVFGAGALWCLYRSSPYREHRGSTAPAPAQQDLASLAEVVRLLVSGSADVSARFTQGESLLEAAVATCQPDLVEPLVTGGVDVNTGHRQPPVVKAAACPEDLLSLLLARGADVGAQDLSRTTVDERLCTAGLDGPTFRARLEALMARGARPRVLDGRTLVFAAGNGNLASVTELLAAGANPNGRDFYGDTPLHGLAEHCWGSECEAKARALLGAGADVGATCRNKHQYTSDTHPDGVTPYELAVANGRAPLFGHLLAKWDWRPLGPLGATASASGVLVEKGRSEDFYSAARAIDGSTDTCWCVRFPDLPTTEEAEKMPMGFYGGPTITIQLPRPARIRALRVYPGCGDNPAIYQANNRVTLISVQLGDNYSHGVQLPDAMRFQDVGFSTAKPLDQIRLQLHTIARGTKYDDTCIAEIQAVLE